MSAAGPLTSGSPGLILAGQLRTWAAQWDGLVDLSPLPSPFLRSWWLTGAGGPGTEFLLVVRDGALVGGLAVARRRRLGVPWVRLAGSGPLCPDHLDLLALPGQEGAVVAAVRTWLTRPGARVLDLAGVRPGSLLAGALPGRVATEVLAGAPWVPLATGDPPASVPRQFRRNLRKARARLAAEGAAHQVRRGQAALASLDVLRRLHQAQWGGRSQFLPAFGRFAAACHGGAARDEVAVHELRAGETVAAVMVSFEVAGRVSLYQSARLTEPRWRDATTVLLAAAIDDARGRGFAEVDFLRGDEPYKVNFAPQRRELLRLRAAHAWPGTMAALVDATARRAKAAGRRALPFQ